MNIVTKDNLSYFWGKLKDKFAPKSHSHDDRYYTESEINTKLSNKVSYKDVILNTNPFGGNQLYINSIDNAMFSANKKWFVTCTLHKTEDAGVTYPYHKSDATAPDYWVDGPMVAGTVSANVLFDGSYEGGINISSGRYLKVHIQFNSSENWSPETATSFVGYPYGDYFFSFYYYGYPNKVEVRTYNRYAAHTIGWHIGEASLYNNVAADSPNQIWKHSDNGNYQRSCIEFIVYGRDNLVGNYMTQLSQIDWRLSRPNLSRDGATVTKYGDQKMYSSLNLGDQTTNKVSLNPNGQVTAIQFNGALNGKAASASSADSVAWGNVSGKPSFFSGNYNDLTNKPTIPTVNNGTLTIQKNGTQVTTFTANQSGNVTANIIVPTTASDIGAYSSVDAQSLQNRVATLESTVSSQGTHIEELEARIQTIEAKLGF